mmetsp:Transcript_58722/g.102774  ORF Transcript_58722/g.102774 Transcript_58722/m.102774 type:complete len:247 (-) Transcript_58722:31-771(-)
MLSSFIFAQVLALAIPASSHDTPYKVLFKVSNIENGKDASFAIQVRPEWAPKAAKHFGALLDKGFFDGQRFWKVSSGFAAQFGARANLSAELCDSEVQEDVRKVQNTRGKLSFLPEAGGSSEIVINIKDNSIMDSKGVIPFAEVTEGLSTIDRIYSGYGTGSKAPSPDKMRQEGNAYLQIKFPKLTYIQVAERVQPESKPEASAFQSSYPVPSTALVAMGVAMCLVLPSGWIISLMRGSSVPAQVL